MRGTKLVNSRAIVARHSAGSLANDGGPETGRGTSLWPRRLLPSESKVLQIGKSDAGHQCVSVYAGLGFLLQVHKTEFLF